MNWLRDGGPPSMITTEAGKVALRTAMEEVAKVRPIIRDHLARHGQTSFDDLQFSCDRPAAIVREALWQLLTEGWVELTEERHVVLSKADR